MSHRLREVYTMFGLSGIKKEPFDDNKTRDFTIDNSVRKSRCCPRYNYSPLNCWNYLRFERIPPRSQSPHQCIPLKKIIHHHKNLAMASEWISIVSLFYLQHFLSKFFYAFLLSSGLFLYIFGCLKGNHTSKTPKRMEFPFQPKLILLCCREK